MDLGQGKGRNTESRVGTARSCAWAIELELMNSLVVEEFFLGVIMLTGCPQEEDEMSGNMIALYLSVATGRDAPGQQGDP